MYKKIFSKEYWKDAALCFKDVRLLCVAALMVALRLIVKLFLKVTIAEGLAISLDCLVNSVGSLIYGPLVGLFVGAVSDTLGCIIAPTGPYFFPFIFVEMTSSFIFGLFLYKQKLSALRVLISKFTVNVVCNIIMNSVFMKWMYYAFYGVEKAQAYALINTVRIAKNLVTFPLEAVLICLFISALLPSLKSLNLVNKEQQSIIIRGWHIALLIALVVLSVALIIIYLTVFKDFISAHNIKIF